MCFIPSVGTQVETRLLHKTTMPQDDASSLPQITEAVCGKTKRRRQRRNRRRCGSNTGQDATIAAPSRDIPALQEQHRPNRRRSGSDKVQESAASAKTDISTTQKEHLPNRRRSGSDPELKDALEAATHSMPTLQEPRVPLDTLCPAAAPEYDSLNPDWHGQFLSTAITPWMAFSRSLLENSLEAVMASTMACTCLREALFTEWRYALLLLAGSHGNSIDAACRELKMCQAEMPEITFPAVEGNNDDDQAAAPQGKRLAVRRYRNAPRLVF